MDYSPFEYLIIVALHCELFSVLAFLHLCLVFLYLHSDIFGDGVIR